MFLVDYDTRSSYSWFLGINFYTECLLCYSNRWIIILYHFGFRLDLFLFLLLRYGDSLCHLVVIVTLLLFMFPSPFVDEISKVVLCWLVLACLQVAWVVAWLLNGYFVELFAIVWNHWRMLIGWTYLLWCWDVAALQLQVSCFCTLYFLLDFVYLVNFWSLPMKMLSFLNLLLSKYRSSTLPFVFEKVDLLILYDYFCFRAFLPLQPPRWHFHVFYSFLKLLPCRHLRINSRRNIRLASKPTTWQVIGVQMLHTDPTTSLYLRYLCLLLVVWSVHVLQSGVVPFEYFVHLDVWIGYSYSW